MIIVEVDISVSSAQLMEQMSDIHSVLINPLFLIGVLQCFFMILVFTSPSAGTDHFEHIFACLLSAVHLC